MRRSSRILLVGVACLMLASPLPAQQDENVVVASLPVQPGQLDAAAARKAIEEANAQWLEAFRAGDAATMARLYTADASLFPPSPSNDILEGRDDIVAFLQEQRRQGMEPPAVQTSDVVMMGNIAYEVGTYRFSFRNAAADTGKYFAIWKHQPDGTWRYHVGIWTSAANATVAN
ncbi:MAG TPA: DUF4440 domain-containing protein [Candidatus Limnocylindrales bacterium]|nr:DUF4440 domain-containing protein [Candidatus Limnocylindrales bacterium]